MICLDLGKLIGNGGIALGKTPDSGERLRSTSKVISLDHVARSIRKNQHSTDQDDGPGELNSNGDAV